MIDISGIPADIRSAVQLALTKIDEHAAAVSRLKVTVNDLCNMAGTPPLFLDEETRGVGSVELRARTPQINVRPDEFFGKPLSTCVRRVLELRKEVDLGPASIPDIYAVMKQGGYHFDARDDENAIRGLGISITKNSALFVRLPNDLIGLVDWYPNTPARRIRLRIRDSNGNGQSPSAAAEQSESTDDISEADKPAPNE